MTEAELLAALATGRPPLEAPRLRRAYGPHPSQFAELHAPDAGPPAPLVVLLHGGFWRHTWSLAHMRQLGAALVRHGFATWNVEHRRVGEDGGGYPGTLDDVLAAARLVPGLAAAGVDPSRTVVLGGSAGGHLALWLGARRDLGFEPRGVVALAPVCDLERASELGLGGGAVDALLGGPPAARPDAYRDASPARRLPLGVPQIVIHGTADRAVPFAESERYCAAARAAGDRAELVALAGVDHFALIDPAGAAFEPTLAAVRRCASAPPTGPAQNGG